MVKKLKDIATNPEDFMAMESIRSKLYNLLLTVYHSVDPEITKELKYYELRFIPENQAKEHIINKYHPEILNDKRETELVVSFREICSVLDMHNNGLIFIDYLATELTPFMSLAYDESEIDANNDYVQRLIKPLMAYEIVRRLTTPRNEISSEAEEDRQTLRTRKVIEDQFYYKGELDWKFAFRKKEDFNLFVTLLIKFFTGEKYDQYSTISLKSSCKTRLARILREIYKELSEDKMRSNERFLDIVRILSPYKDDPNLYRTLTK